MHVDVDFGERHLEEQQDYGIDRWRHDVAVRLGKRMLYDAVANEASVDEDENRVAIELLDLRARDEAVQADLTGIGLVLLFIIFLHLAAPRRRLRQSGVNERQQGAERDELVERLLAEDLVDALRMVSYRRRDKHCVGG